MAPYDSTRQLLRPHTVTVGGPVPLAKPVPVRVMLAFSAALAVDTAVSVGVTSALKEKVHGRSEPVVDSVAGSV